VTLDEARDHVSAHVVYSAFPGDAEEGVIDSVGRKYVYVRYMRSPRPVATLPGNLTLMPAGAADTATSLLQEYLLLRQNGEHAPGGTETWRGWDLRVERFLRSQLATPLEAQ
jgi:hypothetical protein